MIVPCPVCGAGHAVPASKVEGHAMTCRRCGAPFTARGDGSTHAAGEGEGTPSPSEVAGPTPAEVAGPGPAEVAGASSAEVAGPGPAEVAGAGPAEVAGPGPAEVAPSSPAEVAGPGPAEVAPSSPAEVAGPGPAEVAGPGPAEVAGPSPGEVAGPGPAEVAGPSPAEVAGPSPAEVAGPSPADVAAPSPADHAAASPSEVAPSSPAEVAAPTPDGADEVAALREGSATEAEAASVPPHLTSDLAAPLLEPRAPDESEEGPVEGMTFEVESGEPAGAVEEEDVDELLLAPKGWTPPEPEVPAPLAADPFDLPDAGIDAALADEPEEVLNRETRRIVGEGESDLLEPSSPFDSSFDEDPAALEPTLAGEPVPELIRAQPSIEGRVLAAPPDPEPGEASDEGSSEGEFSASAPPGGAPTGDLSHPRLRPAAGPSHAGPSHAGPSHAGPSHAGPSHAAPSHAASGRETGDLTPVRPRVAKSRRSTLEGDLSPVGPSARPRWSTPPLAETPLYETDPPEGVKRAPLASAPSGRARAASAAGGSTAPRASASTPPRPLPSFEAKPVPSGPSSSPSGLPRPRPEVERASRSGSNGIAAGLRTPVGPLDPDLPPEEVAALRPAWRRVRGWWLAVAAAAACLLLVAVVGRRDRSADPRSPAPSAARGLEAPPKREGPAEAPSPAPESAPLASRRAPDEAPSPAPESAPRLSRRAAPEPVAYAARSVRLRARIGGRPGALLEAGTEVRRMWAHQGWVLVLVPPAGPAGFVEADRLEERKPVAALAAERSFEGCRGPRSRCLAGARRQEERCREACEASSEPAARCRAACRIAREACEAGCD